MEADAKNIRHSEKDRRGIHRLVLEVGTSYKVLVLDAMTRLIRQLYSAWGRTLWSSVP